MNPRQMAEALRNTPAQALREAVYLDRAAEMLDASAARAPTCAPWEVHPDDVAVDLFAARMKVKLAAARAKGRGGWDNPTRCGTDFLRTLLHEHVAKGDPVDVANFCMMLAHYGASTANSSQRLDTATVERCAQVAEGFNDPNRDWLPRSVWDNIKRDAAARIRALATEPHQHGGNGA